MLSRVDFSQAYWRWLYEPLYERLLSFGKIHSWPLEQVQARMARLVLGDSSLYLLIALDYNTHITAHCLFALQGTVLYCEQLEADTGISADITEECFKYADTLKATTLPELTAISFGTTEKKYRAFARKYGFTVQKVLLSKELV